MPVEITLNTPLADALNAAILPKLVEVGWGSGGSDDSTLAEYVILMLVNGKTQDQIAAELSNDLLGLSPDDPSVRDFCAWLFNEIEKLGSQHGGAQAMHGDVTSQDNIDTGDMDTDMGSGDVSELNAPTGPRSMRNGNPRGGREKRLLGHMSKAMDRTSDNVLHRTRGNERINTHGRNPPNGPRGGARGGRMNNNRMASMQNGLANMAAGGPQGPGWMMQGQQPTSMDLVAMMEQQNQMMLQLQQAMMNGGGGGGGGGNFGNQRRGGKSLFDRVQDPHHKGQSRRGQHPSSNTNADGTAAEGSGEGEDVDMSGGKREPPNPDENVCKYNLNCTNKDCKFAHQSPAAPYGTAVDVKDICTFGAACKNRKCVARHPSPAQRMAHQSEQDCKFFPNCQNPRCPFKHPSMPLCRNGADCTTANCKFTHVKTKCKFNPCLNPSCAFTHDEGQQGGFKDKVWTPGSGEHVSDRKFVIGDEDEELVKPEPENEQDGMKVEAQEAEVIG